MRWKKKKDEEEDKEEEEEVKCMRCSNYVIKNPLNEDGVWYSCNNCLEREEAYHREEEEKED
jgi:hypothetical protein